jgi:hypothetical protein
MTLPELNRTRRVVLGALLSASTAALIPWAVGETVADTASGAFLALSALIAGRQALDARQGQRLYAALVADDAGFPAAAQALLALINERKIDVASLQKTLDDEKSPLAAVPRKIATAWFAGVVGSGAKARCLAFETALNAQIVADVLKPPSYAYGAYGSWTKEPV